MGDIRNGDHLIAAAPRLRVLSRVYSDAEVAALLAVEPGEEIQADGGLSKLAGPAAVLSDPLERQGNG